MNRRIRRGISCAVLVFPPAPAVTVAVDGRKVAAYVRARVVDGRVYAPLSLVRVLVDRMWFEGGAVVVERAGRRAHVPLSLRFSRDAEGAIVALGPLLRALGDDVRYDARARVLDVRAPTAIPVVPATPYAGRPIPARAVFTPEPVPTPRPTWSGSPLPRRTPLPAPAPTAPG